MVAYILALCVPLEFAAEVLAIRLLRLSVACAVRGLIATGIILMTVRRLMPLAVFFKDSEGRYHGCKGGSIC